MATLTKNSASINIHSIKNMSTNSNSNTNEIDNLPNQLVVDKTICRLNILFKKYRFQKFKKNLI